MILASVGMLLFSVSCKKKDDPKPTETLPPPTAAESKTLMSNIAGSAKSDITDFLNSEGILKLESMQNLSLTDLPKSNTREEEAMNAIVGNGLSTLSLYKRLFVTDPIRIVNARADAHNVDTMFHFNENTGIYTWNNATQEWDQISDDSKIMIKFPTDSSKMDVNDGVLTVYNFKDEYIDGKQRPTSIIAEFKVSGNLLAKVNYTGSFSSDNGYPTAFNSTAFLKPYHLDASAQDGGSSGTANYSFYKENSSPITSSKVTVTFENSVKEKPLLSTGYIQYRDLKISQNVNIKALMDANENNIELSLQEYNSYINIDLHRSSDDAKIADLEFDTSGDGAVIKYADGSIEKPSDVFKPLIDQVIEEEKRIQY